MASSSTVDEDPPALVTINVSGLRFQTLRETLQRFPETLLGSDELEHYYRQDTGEYFFDRNRGAFETVLYYYQSNGIMCLPSYVNPDVFLEELKFYKIDKKVVSKFQAPVDIRGEMSLPHISQFYHRFQRSIWVLLEYPASSALARVIAYWDLVIILLAVASQCLESLPEFRTESCKDIPISTKVETVRQVLIIVEKLSNSWFTINFLFRVLCCPDKLNFVKQILNWFDLLAILPFYLDLIGTGEQNLHFLMILRFFRTLRIVRIFKMSRYFQGLFALGHALKVSAGELVMLALMLITFVVLFSSLVFFTDGPKECVLLTGNNTDTEPDDNKFNSIIHGFWWSIITMSTVGYGDYVPKTTLGKLVGTLCALTGILVISLPFPIIITNFNKFMRVRNSKARIYSTIENGLSDEQLYPLPEYSGVAYGFFQDSKLIPKSFTSKPLEASDSVDDNGFAIGQP